MITEQDLLQAIAECQAERDPDANTCKKLAAYFTIYNQMYGRPKERTEPAVPLSYSYMAEKDRSYQRETITYSGDSEFAHAVNGKEQEQIIEIIDELMTALSVLYPRLYAGVMRKICN